MRIRRDSRGNGPRAGVAALIRALTARRGRVAGRGRSRMRRRRRGAQRRAPARADQHLGHIDEEGITASPAKFGAGPITLLVANQSGASQTLTIDGPRLRRSVGPINPQDTATVRLRVQPGEHTVSAEESAGLREATLTVGPRAPQRAERPAASLALRHSRGTWAYGAPVSAVCSPCDRFHIGNYDACCNNCVGASISAQTAERSGAPAARRPGPAAGRLLPLRMVGQRLRVHARGGRAGPLVQPAEDAAPGRRARRDALGQGRGRAARDLPPRGKPRRRLARAARPRGARRGPARPPREAGAHQPQGRPPDGAAGRRADPLASSACWTASPPPSGASSATRSTRSWRGRRSRDCCPQEGAAMTRLRAITEQNRKWWTLGSMCFALFMIMLDNTVVNVALPSIQSDLGASLSALEWTINAYTLDLRRAARHGRAAGRHLRPPPRVPVRRRRVRALLRDGRPRAERDLSLVVSRAVQGIGAAFMMPATLSIITNAFPAARARQGDRHVGRRLGARARARPGRRRLPDRAGQLARDLLPEPARRRAGRVRDPGGARRSRAIPTCRAPSTTPAWRR